MSKSSILASSDFSTFSQPPWCLFANFTRACKWAFLGRRTLKAVHDFNPLQRSVLLMVIMVSLVTAALRSSTSSCRIVLDCSLTFLIIRFTPCWEILRESPDRGRLIVNWCFFLFFIIASTAYSFSPSCLPNVF